MVEASEVGDRVAIGPYAHLRPGSVVDDDVEIGNYAEIKKSRLGRGVKQHHMSYLGDAEVGAGTNVGAGTITANYDGTRKHRTTIGERVFLGVDTMLRAPVTLGDGSKTGAGAVVTLTCRRGRSWWACRPASASRSPRSRGRRRAVARRRADRRPGADEPAAPAATTGRRARGVGRRRRVAQRRRRR